MIKPIWPNKNLNTQIDPEWLWLWVQVPLQSHKQKFKRIFINLKISLAKSINRSNILNGKKKKKKETSEVLSYWPKCPDKNLYILRKKTVFKIK